MSKKHHHIFFMQIFNDILQINNNNIIIIYDIDGNIWFGLTDILKSLSYSNIQKAMSNIQISTNNKKIYSNLYPSPTGVGLYSSSHTKHSLKPNKIFINESGLYEVLSISTKPLAKLFMDKYFTEIMPSIRKNGTYTLHNSDKLKLHKINKSLHSIKKSNQILKINQYHIIYPSGLHIYIIKQKINNKIYFKIGYTSNLNTRIKVYNTGNANKIYFNYIIPIFNPIIDKCLKNILRNKELIKNKEFYKLSLHNALSYIHKCEPSLSTIYCGYCLQIFTFTSISSHKCKLY